MKHIIYTPDNEPTDMVFDTIEEAEKKIKECPEGYWIDTWFYDYYADMRKRMESYYNFD